MMSSSIPDDSDGKVKFVHLDGKNHIVDNDAIDAIEHVCRFHQGIHSYDLSVVSAAARLTHFEVGGPLWHALLWLKQQGIVGLEDGFYTVLK